MLVGDIYGQDYSRLGLKSTMIASSFGKVFKKGGKKRTFSPEDISKSLLYAISNNIGQIAYAISNPIIGSCCFKTNDSRLLYRYMNAEKYGLDRIYFGGYFIRGKHIGDLPCACSVLTRRRTFASYRSCSNYSYFVLCHPLLE